MNTRKKQNELALEYSQHCEENLMGHCNREDHTLHFSAPVT